MRIAFLPGAYDGCYYYRGYLPAVYGGMTADLNFSSERSNERVHEMAMKADVVVFQRPNDRTRVELMRLLKKKGKKIVFENDDTYLPDKGVPLNMLGSDKQRELAIQLQKNLDEACSLADLCIVSTEKLAEEWRQKHNNVIVLRNTIDPLDEWERERGNGKFRIGLIGSVSSNEDYVHIKEQLTELAHRDDITFVVLGHFKNPKLHRGFEKDESFWANLPNVEWHEFVPVMKYYEKVASMKLDIAIIPRRASYFNECKSDIKFLEMSLLRIPVIAQDFKGSPYRQHAEYLTLATDEWLSPVYNAMNDYQKYATLADKAHDYVVTNYNIENYAPTWRANIEKLCK